MCRDNTTARRSRSAMFTTAFTNGWQSGQYEEGGRPAGRRTDPAETSSGFRDCTLLELRLAAGRVLGLWLRDLHLSVSAWIGADPRRSGKPLTSPGQRLELVQRRRHRDERG